jgi:protein involved in ribonucleotide reduction
MINLFYVSISGNTRAFVKRLCAYAEQQHAKNADAYQINAVEYSESVDVRIMDQPFFAMVPTYLDGGRRHQQRLQRSDDLGLSR